jgi:hypothetical protein
MVNGMERETGIEPATNGLGSRDSTTELLPLTIGVYRKEIPHCVRDFAGELRRSPSGSRYSRSAVLEQSVTLRNFARNLAFQPYVRSLGSASV